MGAGKTTVGKLLAEGLGWEFVDLDDRIREREQRSVPEIFRDSGEEHFREVETDCLREVLAKTRRPSTGTDVLARDDRGLVLSLGGGAIVQPQNADLIRGAEIPVIFLDASPETLFRRCAPQAGARPLLADENQFRQLYESRWEGYMKAGVRIDTAALTPAQVAKEIARVLDLPGYS